MAAEVTVVLGPARAGKTERLLEQYRRQLATGTPGTALWITPTHRSRAEIRSRLLEGSLGACFSPQVFTFESFAQSVLDLSAAVIRPLSQQQRRLLLRRLVDSAVKQGAIGHFAPIAETQGFLDLLLDFIREMKRLEIWPEEFAAACRQRGETAKDRELGALYRSYQQVLLDHQLYDPEGRIWAARRVLKEEPAAGGRAELIVVDGFTDFTRTQHEILQLLAAGAREMLLAMPLEEPPRREDLFAKTLKTLAKLKEYHRGYREIFISREQEPAAPKPWPTLSHIERELFKSPHELQELERVEGVEIMACARRVGEVEQVGERVKRLLHSGVQAEEIAVVLRNTREWAPLIREVFDQLGLPYALESPEPIGAAPAAKALLQLLRLHVGDWPFELLLATLGSNYFSPAWPQWQSGQVQGDIERLVRRLQLPRGRTELLRQARRLAERAVRRASSPETSRQTSFFPQLDAFALLEQLSDELDRLPQRAAPLDWQAALSRLLESTGWLAGIDAAVSLAGDQQRQQRDRAAWQRMKALFEEFDRLYRWLGQPAPELDAHGLLDLLGQWCNSEHLPAPAGEEGRVRVLSAPALRALNVPYLFLAGLSEQSFPQPQREDSLYSEGDKSRLIEHGLPLIDRTERTREEMLLFYEVVTRATRQLVLSYPALDSAAQPLCPSSYLLEVERSCGQGKIPLALHDDLIPVPAHPDPQSAAQWRIRGMAEALDGDVDLLAGLWKAQPAARLSAHLQAALEVIEDRSRGDSFGQHEGVLSDAAGQQLGEQLGPDTLWSPSRLEQYAHCPYQFYLAQVLNLEEPEALALDEDYLTRGHLLHELLAQLHKAHNTKSGGPASISALSLDEYRTPLEEVLEAILARMVTPTALAAAQRELDRRMVLSWSEGYYEQHQKYDALWQKKKVEEPLLPVHFEVRFGPSRSPAADEDCLSTDEPLRLERGGEVVHITGRIDRIDLGRLEGQVIFNVLDYKSGKHGGPKKRDILAGRALQLPLYTMAAEHVLLSALGAKPYFAGYWFVRRSGFNPNEAINAYEPSGDLLQPTDDWRQVQEMMVEKVFQIVRSIRQGAFPVHCEDQHCTSRCSYSTVCRVNQVRSLGKVWPPPAEQIGAAPAPQEIGSPATR